MPRLARTPRGRRITLAAGAGYALCAVALEAYARYHAPAGGGAFRIPVALERGGALVFVASLFGLFARNLLLTGFEHARVSLRRDDARTEESPENIPVNLNGPLTRREVLGAASAAGIVATASGVALYGGLRVARDLRVREFEVFVRDLPPELEGLTIVQVTDIHAGIFTGARDFAAVAERAIALRGDLVVLTGDTLDFSPKHIPDAMAMLARVRGRLGTYAVLGNHDYYAGYAPVLAGLSASGIRTLVNEGIRVPGASSSRPLSLLGLDELVAPRYEPDRGPNLPRAIASLDPAAREAPRILLAHNPVLFRQCAPSVALQLSGHTHGGQINPGGITRAVMPFVSGRYQRGDSTLVVSNGLGLTGPPVRLSAPPEVVRIGLTGRRRA